MPTVAASCRLRVRPRRRGRRPGARRAACRPRRAPTSSRWPMAAGCRSSRFVLRAATQILTLRGGGESAVDLDAGGLRRPGRNAAPGDRHRGDAPGAAAAASGVDAGHPSTCRRGPTRRSSRRWPPATASSRDWCTPSSRWNRAIAARARSSKGAQGLMQVMPDTGRQYGVRDPYEPSAISTPACGTSRRCCRASTFRWPWPRTTPARRAVQPLRRNSAVRETQDYVRRVLGSPACPGRGVRPAGPLRPSQRPPATHDRPSSGHVVARVMEPPPSQGRSRLGQAPLHRQPVKRGQAGWNFAAGSAPPAGRSSRASTSPTARRDFGASSRTRGSYVLSLRRAAVSPGWASAAARASIARQEFLVFNQELATLLKAGMPLVQSLDILRQR